MVQRPVDEDDPTGEEEALEFDGTSTAPLDDTYRLRVVIASESPNGTVAFDERGQAQWKWITELTPASPDASDTFDLLKALDAPKLRLKDDAPPAPEPTGKTGYDPYATGVFPKPKIPPMTARDAKQPSTDASPGRDPETTLDLLKALENAAIVMDEAAPPAPETEPEPSFNPYNRGVAKPGRGA